MEFVFDAGKGDREVFCRDSVQAMFRGASNRDLLSSCRLSQIAVSPSLRIRAPGVVMVRWIEWMCVLKTSSRDRKDACAEGVVLGEEYSRDAVVPAKKCEVGVDVPPLLLTASRRQSPAIPLSGGTWQRAGQSLADTTQDLQLPPHPLVGPFSCLWRRQRRGR